jgi:hypothetical protein
MFEAQATSPPGKEAETMLGEQVAEFRGKVTGQRVLPPEGSVPKFETTVEHSGTVLGVASTFTATFWSVIRPDGKIYGENPRQGVLMTEDGDMALFSGTGLGGFTGRGSASKLRGAVYWETTSQRLARLNQEAHVFEWDVDENGEVRFTLWEWT